LEGREILRSSLDDFRQGQPLSVIDHADASPDGVTLRRAMSRIGEQNYNLLFNNCEHFATWCKTGRHRSGQIDSVLERARHWSGLMPSALMRGLELLVQRGLLDDNARQVARQGVAKLERLRQKLLGKLETLLQQAGEGGNRTLLLSGQSLADELAAVEELKQKIDTLLEQPALPGQDRPE
ncbi:MAG: lecithin retinol acyltransferase family protein, partial [Cyanobacteriota bacterium]|nr:lecithin retinol acyltransferase family protein [Cyanobacteriota bacterium]